MSLRKIAAILILAVLVIGSGIKERKDAAEKQHHAIYDEALWFVG